jgi:hypothetical protein
MGKPILIAHRGNLYGPNKERENTPSYIKEALDKGFHVEIDVWKIDGHYYLGHDSPDHKISFMFLVNDRLWCHAKNFEALDSMIRTSGIHCFYHVNDAYTITSRGILWVYPGNRLSNKCICVMPELCSDLNLNELENVFGICGDYVGQLVQV